MLIRAVIAAVMVFLLLRILPFAIGALQSIGAMAATLGCLALILVGLVITIKENEKEVLGCIGPVALIAALVMAYSHPVATFIALIGFGVAAQVVAKKYAERQQPDAPVEPDGPDSPTLPPLDPEKEA